MTLSDNDLNDIYERARERFWTIKPGLKNAEHPMFKSLYSMLQQYLSGPRINPGNVHGDELADFLIDKLFPVSKKIKDDTKHTPTPYAYKRADPKSISGCQDWGDCWIIYHKNDDPTKELFVGFALSEQDAIFIVNTCNSH